MQTLSNIASCWKLHLCRKMASSSKAPYLHDLTCGIAVFGSCVNAKGLKIKPTPYSCWDNNSE